MLEALVVLLVVLWLVGLLAHIGGGLIHFLFVIALIIFIYQMITSRRSR